MTAVRFAFVFLFVAACSLSANDFAPFKPVKRWERKGLPGAKDVGEIDLAPSYAYFKGAQQPDGSWASPKGEHDVATTSLVVLAYLGNGYTHRFGEHKAEVAKGLRWLKAKKVSPAGELGWLDASLRCMALGEAYAVSRDFTLKPAVQAACEDLLLARGEDGGWGNSAGQASNSLATTYGVLALKALKTGGIAVEREAFEQAAAVLGSRTDAKGLVGFCEPGDAASLSLGEAKAKVPLFTAGSTIARVFCGQRRSVAGIRGGVELLMDAGLGTAEPLYTYLATYSLFQFGGEKWKAWQPALKGALLSSRLGKGEHAGSWEPQGLIGELCGRPGETALQVHALEIVLRYEMAMR